MVVKMMVCVCIQSALQIDLKKYMKMAADSGKVKYFELYAELCEIEFEFESDRVEGLKYYKIFVDNV